MKINRIKKFFQYTIRGIRFVNIDNISIANNVSIGRLSLLQTWPQDNCVKPELIIKENVYIGNNCQISCMKKIEIEENTTLGDNVFITDNYHGNNRLSEINIHPLQRKLYSKGEVKIGKNVLVGRNVCILAGVSIGNGAVIGANSVVTHDIGKNTVVAGCPAKLIKNIN